MNELNRSDDARYELDVLFSDGMPERDENAGYRGAEAAKAAGITYRQLDYWARTELVVPTVRDASGSGSQRLYGFHIGKFGSAIGRNNDTRQRAAD